MERWIKFLIIVGIVVSPASFTYANSVSKHVDLLLQQVQTLQEQIDVLNISKNKLSSLSAVTYDNKVALKRHKKEILRLKQCGNGNDFYDGGEGFDTIEYTGERDQFFITKHEDNSYTFKDLISCRADTDTVINIERFVFKDGERTVSTLKPDRVISTSKASIKLSSPKKNKRDFTLGDDIEIKWQIKNAPENAQVLYKLTQITSDGYGLIGGGSGQSGEIKKGSSKGSVVWRTGGVGYLDATGTYRIDVMVRECAPSGCMDNADFPGREQEVEVYAVSDESVVVAINQKKSAIPSIGSASVENTKLQVGESTDFAWSIKNPRGTVKILLKEHGKLDIPVYSGPAIAHGNYSWAVELPQGRNTFGGSAYLELYDEAFNKIEEKHISALAINKSQNETRPQVSVIKPTTNKVVDRGGQFEIGWKTTGVDPYDYLHFTLKNSSGEYQLGGGYYAINGNTDFVTVQQNVPKGTYQVRVYANQISCTPSEFSKFSSLEKGGFDTSVRWCESNQYGYGDSEGLITVTK